VSSGQNSWPLYSGDTVADGVEAVSGERPPSDAVIVDSSAFRREDELELGTVVGDYCIDELIGRGGMGDVYRATHLVIGKVVAIKLLREAHHRSHVDRLIREARTVNQIGHPNIVDVSAFGMLEDGRPYIVMELLEGESLDQALKRGPMSASSAFEILEPVVAALLAAQDTGVVHRDIKPANVFLVRMRGAPPLVKLLDFGLAKPVGSESDSNLTTEGIVMGTPAYFSPEQATGKDITSKSDVYSLGVMLFEMLAGRLPFEAPSSLEVAWAHVREAAPRLSKYGVHLSRPVERVLARMLAKDPTLRPALEELQTFVRGVNSGSIRTTPSFVVAHRRLAIGVGALLALLSGSALGIVTMQRSAQTSVAAPVVESLPSEQVESAGEVEVGAAEIAGPDRPMELADEDPGTSMDSAAAPEDDGNQATAKAAPPESPKDPRKRNRAAKPPGAARSKPASAPKRHAPVADDAPIDPLSGMR